MLHFVVGLISPDFGGGGGFFWVFGVFLFLCWVKKAGFWGGGGIIVFILTL